MTEVENDQQPVESLKNQILAEIIAEKEPENAAGFLPFLKFLREKVTVEQLLNDRLAQANLDIIIDTYGSDDQIGNPFPTIRLATPPNEEKGWGRGAHWVNWRAFMLEDDNEHLYFIDSGWPYYVQNQETGNYEFKKPEYLRQEDIIPPEKYKSDDNKHPYAKPLQRVPIKAGNAQLYNYNSKQWKNQTEYSNGVEDLKQLERALNILAIDESELIKFGEKVLKARKDEKQREKRKRQKEDKKNTFSLKFQDQNVGFKTFTVEEMGTSFLANYLQWLSSNSRLLNIIPDTDKKLKSFGIKVQRGTISDEETGKDKPIYIVASPFESEFGNFVEEKGENRDEIPAYFLGAFNHPKIRNWTFRLIAISEKHLPKDVAFQVATKSANDVDFKNNQLGEIVTAKISVNDEEVRPWGFKNGEYVIFAACDLIDPIGLGGKNEEENPLETVRIVGLSKSKKSLFFRDVDVSEVPVKFMRLAEERDKIGSGAEKLPPAKNLILGK